MVNVNAKGDDAKSYSMFVIMSVSIVSNYEEDEHEQDNQ